MDDKLLASQVLLTLPFASIDLLCKERRVGSGFTDVQSEICLCNQQIEFDLTLNPLPDDMILDWSKLKQIADDILTLSQTSPGFYVSKSVLKTLWKKEKLLETSNFSFSQCFLSVWKTFCHFHQT